MIKEINVETHYFKVKKIGNSCGIEDPDNLIEKAEWKSSTDVKRLEHMYPEDEELLLKEMKV
ncbi:hypothetical protein KP77_11820 [Jeotgalibacillus alimentarius]|uniref:Uncharacterized protein n=1 Tax=Jeotgalibacillus alimentarius TaxID=135826 RepID=A0A0C2RN38_9BACL|nr:hypothetical protein KP77_11820 [Jeotgalibacillus alimentarius]